MRIAVGGFQHETNTFAPSKAELKDFTIGGGWPPLSRGGAMFGSIAGVNLPAAGFVEAARERGWTPVPLAWAGATPSSYVTDEAFETIAGHILDGLEHAGSLDAVYLDLHGVMVTESHEDGEGELLRRVRNLLGSDIPILVSLDLHANVTPEMMALATALVSYRTYPHVDQAVTGKRAARLLDLWVERGGQPFASAFRQIPFLIPLTSGCSLIEPAKAIYDSLDSLETGGVDSVSFNAGFSPADIHHAGPTVTVFGRDQAAVDAVADGLASSILAQEAAFAGDIMGAADGVAYAKGQAAGASRPIVLADTQDNPGAGGNGDTVGLLAELVRQEASGAALALLYDPPAAERAHQLGAGAEGDFALGSQSGLPGHEPLKVRAKVAAVGDGRFTCTGPFYLGARMDLGPMARLRIGAVDVLIASKKVQAGDQEMFRHLGLEPTDCAILGLKSSVHFRAHFQPIAQEVVVVAAPGPNPVDHLALDYRNLRGGIRLMPNGPLSKDPLAAGGA